LGAKSSTVPKTSCLPHLLAGVDRRRWGRRVAPDLSLELPETTREKRRNKKNVGCWRSARVSVSDVRRGAPVACPA